MTESGTNSVYVDRFYEMSPEFEDIIYGSELADGQIVLLEDTLLRGDPERAFFDSASRYELARVREVNRWCTVTRLQRHGDLVTFIAEYADGTKMVRTYHGGYAWLVKK